MHMHVGDRFMRIIGVTARSAGCLPWKKQMPLAALFIGTPFVMGNVEYGVLNLVGLGIGVVLLRKVTQSRRRAEAVAPTRRTR